MSTGNDRIRTELERKFQPPIEVLLDPSLLAASTSLERLSNSTVFDSQTQATLGQAPTEPRVGDLFVPATFRELLEAEEQLDVQKTGVWNFYRGQAEGAFRDDIVNALDQNGVRTFTAGNSLSDLRWDDALDDPTRQDQLQEILQEEFAFLRSGGLILARTSTSLETLRDAGMPTIDIGQAELEPELRETLTDIGYGNPAGICAFGVFDATSTVDALIGDVLATDTEVLLYRLST